MSDDRSILRDRILEVLVAFGAEDAVDAVLEAVEQKHHCASCDMHACGDLNRDDLAGSLRAVALDLGDCPPQVESDNECVSCRRDRAAAEQVVGHAPLAERIRTQRNATAELADVLGHDAAGHRVSRALARCGFDGVSDLLTRTEEAYVGRRVGAAGSRRIRAALIVRRFKEREAALGL